VADLTALNDLQHNRGKIADPAQYARDANAASWLYLCGEAFASMDGGMSYADVEAAVSASANVVSDPPVVMDMESRRLIGTITERHLAVRVIAAGRDPRRTLVREVMEPSFVACRGEDDVEEARAAMCAHGIAAVAIIDELGALHGIVTREQLREKDGDGAQAVWTTEEQR